MFNGGAESASTKGNLGNVQSAVRLLKEDAVVKHCDAGLSPKEREGRGGGSPLAEEDFSNVKSQRLPLPLLR